MSTYEKPMVMVNEELAEGVYACSGCWSGRVKKFRKVEGDKYAVDLDYKHDGSQGHSNVTMEVTFNQDVSVVVFNGNGTCECYGDTLIISWESFNPTEGYGPSVEVEALGGFELEKPSVTIRDEH